MCRYSIIYQAESPLHRLIAMVHGISSCSIIIRWPGEGVVVCLGVFGGVITKECYHSGGRLSIKMPFYQ